MNYALVFLQARELGLQASLAVSHWPSAILVPGVGMEWLRKPQGRPPKSVACAGCWQQKHRVQTRGTQKLGKGFKEGCVKHTGKGNGNPLQCSCLENPGDQGAWWAACLWGRTESDMTEVT